MSPKFCSDFSGLHLGEAQAPEMEAGGEALPQWGATERPDSAGPADDFTCAICLKNPPPQDTAQPVGCDHIYCTCCLLHWAVYKEKPICPQCKVPFSSLLTFRTVDGEVHDYPCQESVGMLKRAPWFQEHLKMKEAAMAEASLPEALRGSASSGRGGRHPGGWVIDESDYLDYGRYYAEYDDDEEVEDYFFSSAAGRARVVIGNRRHGPNGFLSSGRLQARTWGATQQQAKGGKGKGAAEGAARTPGKQASKLRQIPATPKQGSGSSSSHKGSPCVGESYVDSDSSPCGSFGKASVGRRARRNQRKAAADAKGGM